MRTTPEMIAAFVVCAVTLTCVADLSSQDSSPPIYERDPFDLLVLTKENGNARLQIYPVFPDGKFQRGRDDQSLRVRLLAYPDREFDADWRDIRTVILFEELLLQGAKRQIAAGRYESAHQYLTAIREKTGPSPTVDKAVLQYMSKAAQSAANEGRLYEAWGTLDFVVRRRDDSEAALEALFEVADKIFDRELAATNFVDARDMIGRMEQRYGPQRVKPLVSNWDRDLQQLSAEYVARATAPGVNPLVALDAIEQALQLWPSSKQIEEVARQLTKDYPRVIVGVRRSATTARTYWNEWSTRRTDRLQFRRINELTSVDSDGARYESPVGRLQVDRSGESLTSLLDADAAAVTKGGLTGYDLADVLLESTRSDLPDYFPLWHQLLRSVKVPSATSVQLELQRPSLRSAAFMTLPLTKDSEGSLTESFSPYIRGTSGRFQINESYVYRQEGQPIEIVERVMDGAALATELRRGTIHVADRLGPLDVATLDGVAGIYTRRYLFPSIHYLVPNTAPSPRRRLVEDRNFRRALTFAIDRKTILEQELLGGRPSEGCQQISGPFAPGRGADDPMAYAYDESIEPREYDPTLGITLAGLARREWKKYAEKAGWAIPDQRAPLILVHTDDSFCRHAVEVIASYLNAAKFDCVLRQLPVGEVLPAEGEAWDLLYVDTVMSEPLLDVHRLFGEGGGTSNTSLLGAASPYLQAAMQRLSAATVWAEARATLREMHRLTHEELTVIPLWQWTDYFAYREYLQGVRRNAVSLYQDVENWTVNPSAGF